MLFLGADHAGFAYKEQLRHYLADRGVSFEDFGVFSDEPADFPRLAKQVAKAVVKHDGRGILLCGSGVGMGIAANRFKHIRAAVCWNNDVAHRARDEDDANILVLPARLINSEDVVPIVSTFLSTTFSHTDRYKRRLKQIDEE